MDRYAIIVLQDTNIFPGPFTEGCALARRKGFPHNFRSENHSLTRAFRSAPGGRYPAPLRLAAPYFRIAIIAACRLHAARGTQKLFGETETKR